MQEWCPLHGHNESLPGHRVFRRDDQIGPSLLSVSKKPAEPSSSETAIPIFDAGGTCLYVTVRLYQEHGVIAFIRDQSIEHRRDQGLRKRGLLQPI